MESLIGIIFNFGKDHIGSVLSILVGGGGVFGFIAKGIGKIPFLRVSKYLKLMKEFGNVVDELQKATDEKGDGGKDITEKEWASIFKDGRKFAQEIAKLKS